MAQTDLKHWRTEPDADGILWCSLDYAGGSTNVLGPEVIGELGQLVALIEESKPRGVVIHSAKENGFIAGADVRQFTQIADPAEAEKLIREVHALFDRLERLSSPTLCLIHGFCLGGGLELALACRYRIACDDPATRIGFPEVMLGIIPGFGGTMRSIRRAGPVQALQLMLTGRTLDARKAQGMGLVDRAVPERQLRPAARSLLLSPPRSRTSLLQRYLWIAPLRRLLAGYMRGQLRGKARIEHYPAPYALIDHWEVNGGNDRDMLEGEAATVARLLVSSTSRNLVRVYLLQERLKSLGREDGPAIGHVHVIGAGVMGGDIAAWCAAQGLQVSLQDREARFIAPAMRRGLELFHKRFKKSRPVQAAMDRLMPDLRGSGVPAADVVIEAIIENREAKRDLFRSLEPRMKPGAILATNTSSIALETLDDDLQRPERLVGIHFFNPVSRMQLVEIVRGAATGAEWVNRAAAFCRAISRLPLPVLSSPGFLVNRILTPYLMETTAMLEEGIDAELIDDAAVRFGMPMGPVELADTVGLDICLSVARNMSDKLSLSIPARLEDMVKAGRLGKKSGRGFYTWRSGKPVRKQLPAGSEPPPHIEDRLILRILNECAACLREGIVEDADLLDAGMIFGTGFAPFRGGPVQHARDRGIDTVIADLEDLAVRFGDRFRPDSHWQSLLKNS